MSDPFAQHDQPAGAALLDDLEAFLARFVAFPSEPARVAVTLWAAHTHGLDYFESTPRLALLSPEPGSGKTRAQEVLELLVPRPMFSLNTSAAALFRKVADPDGRPTVLLDEVDTVFGPRAAKEHEDLRGMVNGGHRRGATATRCVVRGKEVTVEDYPCYAAVSLSGLDDLPDTIMTRAVVVRMRRRAPHEQVEPFRHRLHSAPGHDLRERLAAWVASVADELRDAWPDMPDGIVDRPADVWEPLLALADAAGGDWPERARVAAVALVAESRAGGETLGIKLLRDVRAAFHASGTDRMSTQDLLDWLHEVDESPWADLRGKPLDARGLSRRLHRYEVRPVNVKVDGKPVKGYRREDLHDAWTRYLPADEVAEVAEVADSAGGGEGPDPLSVAANTDVAVGWVSPYGGRGQFDDPSPVSPELSATSATSATGAVPTHACGGLFCRVPGCTAPAEAVAR